MSIDKKSCFVIMPFSEPFETYYKKIVMPAIEEMNLYSVRGDSLFRSTHIMDDIWESINYSSVVIADLTSKNPNVFYELGLSHAQRKPVILLSSTIDDVPFDLRPLRVLIYDKDEPDWGSKLKSNIISAIKEILESPSRAVPHTFREHKKPSSQEELSLSDRIDLLEESINSIKNLSPKQEHNFYGVSEAQEVLDGYSHSFQLGDTVFHHKFGKGKVIELNEQGSLVKIRVNFEEYGVRALVLPYAKLEKA